MKTAVTAATASAPAESAEGSDDQSFIAKMVAQMDSEEQANKTPKAGNEVPGAEAEEADDDESPAEPAEEADEAEALSQAEESGTTEEAEATEETPEAEAEETPAEEPTKAPRIGELLDEIEELKPEQREAINERVNQVVRDRVGKVNAKLSEAKTALEAVEQRAVEAETKVQELEANGTTAPTRNAENPLGHVKTEADLQKEATKAESALEEAGELLLEVDTNPKWVAERLKAAGFKLQDASGDEDFSPQRMRAQLERVKNLADKTLRKHLPQKAQELTARKTFDAELVESYPELKDSKNPFTVRLNEVLKLRPEYAAFPEGRLLIANAIYGNAKRKAEMAAAKKPAAKPPLAKTPPPKVKPAPVATRAAGKPTAKEGAKSAALIAAEKKYAESGSDKDLIALVALRG
jgi:hypothetical protein